MGAGAIHLPDFYNAPRVGLFTVNDHQFDLLTQRLDIPVQVAAIPGAVLGETMTFKIPGRGIVSDIRLHFDLDLVVASYSAFTLYDKWIYDLIRQVTVRANNTDLVKLSGMDLAVLRQQRYKSSDFSDLESTAVSASNGTKNLDFILDIPLCTDPQTRKGSVFAQTDDTMIEVEIQFESAANLYTLTTTTFAFSGSVRTEVTAWEVPTVNAPNGQRALVLPDLSVHSIINTRRLYINSAGVHRVPFSQTYGQLLRYNFVIWDESTKSFINCLTGGVGEVKFQYGQNQTLRRHSIRNLLHLNAQWYRDILMSRYLAFDFVAENSFRDVVVPADVMDMELEIDLSGATIAAGDYIKSTEWVVKRNEAFAEAQRVQMQPAA